MTSIFTALGSGTIFIKYELSNLPKVNQLPGNQVAWTSAALLLSIIGGQLSVYYSAEWYGGLLIAVIGAFIMSFQDYGGVLPTAASLP